MIIDPDGIDIGRAGEERILQLLENNDCPSWMTRNNFRTQPNSVDDQRGIDIWIGTIAGFIPIQVKSLNGRAGRSRGFYRQKGIGFVAIRTSRSKQTKNDLQLYTDLMREIKELFDERKEKLKKSVECVMV